MNARLPEFPVEAFPLSLRHYCESVAEATQTPLEMTAMVMLGALSTVSLGAQVDAGNGWIEELGLYTLIVMAAAERKSSVMRIVTSPLRELEDYAREQELEELREERSRKAVFEHRRRYLLSRYGKTDDAEERKELWDEIKDCDRQLDMFGELAAYRLLADDVTAEGLSRLLTIHGRIGILSAEGSAIDNIVGGRYSDGNSKLDIVLKAYSGEAHTVDRSGRDSEHAQRPLLSMTLAVQEDYLTNIIDHTRSRSLGLVSRFSFVTPRSRLGTRTEVPEPVDPMWSGAWSKTLRAVFTALYKKIADTNDKRAEQGICVSSVSGSLNKGEETTLSLSLSTTSQARLRELQRELEPTLGPGGDLAHVADWAGRHLGRILRVAGLLHLAESKTESEAIDLDTFARAEEIGAFLMAHGRNALEEPNTSTLRAQQVLERWKSDTITVRDLHRQVFHSRGTAEDATRLAGQLAEDGHLEYLPTGPGGRGRPGSPTDRITSRTGTARPPRPAGRSASSSPPASSRSPRRSRTNAPVAATSTPCCTPSEASGPPAPGE